MASWRFSSACTACLYSGLSSRCSVTGKSFGARRSARLSRGGLALRTEVRPVAATDIWVPTTFAKEARPQA